MPTQRKTQSVEALTDRLSRSTIAIATSFGGVSGAVMTDFRKYLRSSGMEYKVVKNTLLGRAADAAGRSSAKELLEGSTGFVFGYGDPVAHAKAVLEYVRSNRMPIEVRGAVVEGRVYLAGQLVLLTTLPPREVLAGQLVGQLAGPLVRLVTVMNQPLQGLANVLNGPMRGLASVLQQRVVQQGGA